jgi:hypothetical protein
MEFVNNQNRIKNALFFAQISIIERTMGDCVHNRKRVRKSREKEHKEKVDWTYNLNRLEYSKIRNTKKCFVSNPK